VKDFFETSTWTRPENHDPVVGRVGVKGFEPGKGITGFIDDNVPAGHTFGTLHDAFFDAVKIGFAPLDWASNILSMPPAYVVAIGVETVNSVTDITNGLFGTDYDLSFNHNHPK